MLRKIRYGIEAFFLAIFWLVFRLLPLDVASYVGGWIGRCIGPFTRAHRTADNNISRVLPQYSAEQRTTILSDMWDNLGRVMGEYPHLSRPIMQKRIVIEGTKHLDEAKAISESAFYVSGHFANWEIIPVAAAAYGTKVALVYRAPNNPVTDWFIRQTRKRYSLALFNKGREGAVQVIKALKKNQSVGLLLDQKLNDGEAVPFFGYPAMTATAGIALALRAGAAILPTHVVRTGGAHFRVTIYPPILYAADTTAYQIMEQVHALFESWIREHPAQWFWVHNRWDWKKL